MTCADWDIWVRAKGPWVWIGPSSIQSSTDYKASLVFWVQRTSWGLLFCFFAELKEECSEIWRWKLAKFAVDLVSFSRNILRHQNQIHGQCSFRFPYFCGETDFTWFLILFAMCFLQSQNAVLHSHVVHLKIKSITATCGIATLASGRSQTLTRLGLAQWTQNFPIPGISGRHWETLGD